MFPIPLTRPESHTPLDVRVAVGLEAELGLAVAAGVGGEDCLVVGGVDEVGQAADGLVVLVVAVVAVVGHVVGVEQRGEAYRDQREMYHAGLVLSKLSRQVFFVRKKQ